MGHKAVVFLLCMVAQIAFAKSSDSVAPNAATPAAATRLAEGNQKFDDFARVKKIAAEIHLDHSTTIYCPCKYTGKRVDLKSCDYKVHKDPKRAVQLEWEHVVPAHAFGQSFKEWREGDPKCVRKSGKRYKGRQCAERNPEFARMNADLYNLWPSIGELNGLRSNYSMAVINEAGALSFGGCRAKVHKKKFEPMDQDKGVVARVYLYMDEVYPGRGIVSEKNRKLFASWDKQYPATQWECQRADRIRTRQGNANQILASRCPAPRLAEGK